MSLLCTYTYVPSSGELLLSFPDVVGSVLSEGGWTSTVNTLGVGTSNLDNVHKKVYWQD